MCHPHITVRIKGDDVRSAFLRMRILQNQRVCFQMPQISFPISNMIYTVNVEQVLDVTNVTTVEFSNEEDCVAFQCSVTSDSNKIFWYTGTCIFYFSLF